MAEIKFPLQEGCPSDLLLDRLDAGELGEAEASSLATHVARCQTCAARMADIQASPPYPAEDRLVRALDLRRRLRERKAESGLPAWWRRFAWIPTAVTALLAVVLGVTLYSVRSQLGTTGGDGAWSGDGARLGTTGGDGAWSGDGARGDGARGDTGAEQKAGEAGQYRVKGPAETLGVFVKRGDAVRRAESGDSFRPGDHVQFSYFSGSPGFVAVFGLDPKKTTRYVPQAGTEPVRVAAGKDTLLEPAIRLDATLGAELVVALFCPYPFDVAEMERNLSDTQGTAPFQAPADCRAVLFRMEKGDGAGRKTPSPGGAGDSPAGEGDGAGRI